MMRRLAPLLMGFAFAGCATIQPPSATLPAVPSPSPQQLQELTTAMRARDRGLVTLNTEAVMEYRNPSQHVKAREQIVVMRPAMLRVEASSPFGVALIVAVDGPRLQIYEPGKNLLMYGAANAATLDRFAQIPMEPGAAVDLLMAIAPDPEELAAHGQAVIDSGGAIIITYTVPSGGRREAGFVGGRLTTVRATDAAGHLVYEVHYADYHDIGALMFPYSIDADFPAAGSELKLALKRPIVNAEVTRSMFTLAPGSSTKEINLDQPQPMPPAPHS